MNFESDLPPQTVFLQDNPNWIRQHFLHKIWWNDFLLYVSILGNFLGRNILTLYVNLVWIIVNSVRNTSSFFFIFWRKIFWFRNCIFLSSPLFFNHFLKDKFWIEELYFSICGNILELGGLLLKSFDKIRVLLFYSQTELVIYVFGVFIGIIGGTPDKRFPEGLFWRFSIKFAF